MKKAVRRPPRLPRFLLPRRHCIVYAVDFVPRACRLQRVIHCLDVFQAFGFEPFAERSRALLSENGNTVGPSGASAENAVVLHAGLADEAQRFSKLGIAYASREIDERLGGG